MGRGQRRGEGTVPAGRSRRGWSDVEVVLLIVMSMQGRSIEIIARKLGRTWRAVFGKHLQMSRPDGGTWTPDEDALLWTLWTDPAMSTARIGARFPRHGKNGAIGRAGRLGYGPKRLPLGTTRTASYPIRVKRQESAPRRNLAEVNKSAVDPELGSARAMPDTVILPAPVAFAGQCRAPGCGSTRARPYPYCRFHQENRSKTA